MVATGSESRALAMSWPHSKHDKFVRVLRDAARQWFNEQELETHARYPYSLRNHDDWRKNIILPEVASYLDEVCEARKEGFALHSHVHHGLSSQAMLFNLVGPLIVRDDLGPFRLAIEEAGAFWPATDVEIELEQEDKSVFNEVTGQPTSVDLVIRPKSGAGGLFVECKLSENEFGGCSVFRAGNCDGANPASDFTQCYLHHIGRLYWERLEALGLLRGPLAENHTCLLANYYQFFREVGTALHHGGDFVLLADARNPAFFSAAGGNERGVFPLLKGILPAAIQKRVHYVSIQSVVARTQESPNHADWISSFRSKYGMDAGR